MELKDTIAQETVLMSKEDIMDYWQLVLRNGFKEIAFGTGVLEEIQQVLSEEEYSIITSKLEFISENTAILKEVEE